MGKLDQMRALGRPQIGRIARQQEALPVQERVTNAKVVLNNVTRSENQPNKGTQAVNKGTRGRGRPASALSKAERQKLYRERLKAKQLCNG